MPDPRVFAPVWLSIADVKDQLRIDLVDLDDDDLITRSTAMTEPQVERARPDCWQLVPPDELPREAREDPAVPPTRVYVPDADVYGAAVMLAARLVRRRNSPGGVESFAESIHYVSRYDPDIQRALRQGDYAFPASG